MILSEAFTKLRGDFKEPEPADRNGQDENDSSKPKLPPKPAFTLPKNSPVKERSAEATVIQLLFANYEDPYVIKAIDVLREFLPHRVKDMIVNNANGDVFEHDHETEEEDEVQVDKDGWELPKVRLVLTVNPKIR